MANEQILQDPNYLNANPATQQAIRDRYGIMGEAPGETKSPTLGPIKEGVKNFAKGAASLADTALEGATGAVNQTVVYPAVRPFVSAQRAEQIASPAISPIGRAFGIENDPAYKNEASRRAVQAVGEAVAPAITKVSEVTGLPEQDVANMANTLSLGAAKPISSALRRPVGAIGGAVSNVDDAITARVNALRGKTPEGSVSVQAAPDTAAMAAALRNVNNGAPPESSMSGVGSATPGEAQIRINRAQELPVPIKLTAGEAGRESSRAQFEHDIARQGDLGAPIRERKAVNNERLQQNFDKLVDEIEPQFAKPETSRLVGEETRGALTENFKKARDYVKKLYEDAKASNADRVVNIRDINDYVLNLTPSERASPPIKALLETLEKNNLGDANMVRFNDLQEGYRTINRVTNSNDNTQLHYAGKLKEIINKIGDEQADDTFRVAQAARRKLGQEYQNNQAVEKIIGNKKGRYSADAQIATEDIVDSVVRRGSLEDLKKVENALGKSERGKAAMNEIRAQTLLDFKNAITKNITENERGQRVISPKALDTLVREMDADGKLDHLFGTKGAQTLRDIRDVAVDISYIPQGANTSGTTHALTRLVDRIGRGTGIGDPFGVMKTLAEGLNNLRIKKEVSKSLNYDPKDLAKELRKSRKNAQEGAY